MSDEECKADSKSVYIDCLSAYALTFTEWLVPDIWNKYAFYTV